MTQRTKIATCRTCKFQVFHTEIVDWDDEYECSLCSPTRKARFVKKTMVKNQKVKLCDYCKHDYHDRCTLVYLPNRVDLCSCACTITTTDVHTEHCCLIHGCKYGYDDPELKHLHDKSCSVVEGGKQQTYPCEECQITMIHEPDEPYMATSGWSIWKVDKGKEKQELLDKIRQFLWMLEHKATFANNDEAAAYNQLFDSHVEDICTAHNLRVDFDKVFGENGE